MNELQSLAIHMSMPIDKTRNDRHPVKIDDLGLRVRESQELCVVAYPDKSTVLNGNGFDESKASGRGLVNIRSRLDAVGGEVSISSDAGGTKVYMMLPADDPHVYGGVEAES